MPAHIFVVDDQPSQGHQSTTTILNVSRRNGRPAAISQAHDIRNVFFFYDFLPKIRDASRISAPGQLPVAEVFFIPVNCQGKSVEPDGHRRSIFTDKNGFRSMKEGQVNKTFLRYFYTFALGPSCDISKFSDSFTLVYRLRKAIKKFLGKS